MFIGWPTYQIVIMAALLLGAMSMIVYGARKSAKDAGAEFSLIRFFVGLAVGVILLGILFSNAVKAS